VSVTPTIENATSDTIRVLLVEDDDGDALLLRRLLSGWQYASFHIRRAHSLSAAILELAQGAIDLVLLDLGLPESRGLDTLARIRAASARAPIIVLSGLHDEALAVTAIRQGAQDYIVKGQVDGASLVQAIRFAIERHRVQQALAERVAELEQAVAQLQDQDRQLRSS